MPPVICYSLEDAAEKLNLSETVLVRLSQYFKVPEVAYEETGFLSFKGDLSFTDRDLHFFREVRERLLAGYNLDQLRAFFSQQAAQQTPVPEELEEAEPQQAFQTYIDPTAMKVRPAPPREDELLTEVDDAQPFQKMAEKTFAKYKNIHQPKERTDVLKNLAKGFQTSAPSVPPLAPISRDPVFKPLKQTAVKPHATPPVSQQTATPTIQPPPKEPVSAEPSATLPVTETIEWGALLANAKRQTVPLSDALQRAASELRQQASQRPF